MITLSGDSRTIGPLIFNATRSEDTGFMSSMPIATQPTLYRIHPGQFSVTETGTAWATRTACWRRCRT